MCCLLFSLSPPHFLIAQKNASVYHLMTYWLCSDGPEGPVLWLCQVAGARHICTDGHICTAAWGCHRTTSKQGRAGPKRDYSFRNSFLFECPRTSPSAIWTPALVASITDEVEKLWCKVIGVYWLCASPDYSPSNSNQASFLSESKYVAGGSSNRLYSGNSLLLSLCR